jgi:hypothetical protein
MHAPPISMRRFSRSNLRLTNSEESIWLRPGLLSRFLKSSNSGRRLNSSCPMNPSVLDILASILARLAGDGLAKWALSSSLMKARSTYSLTGG